MTADPVEPPPMVEVVEEPTARVSLPDVIVVEKGLEPVLTRLVEVGGLPKMTSVWPIQSGKILLE